MNEKMSLTELQQAIRDTLYTTLPGLYWINAEISEITVNSSGHCYLELIDKQPGSGNIKARARAIIWANKYRMIKPFFETTTGETLKAGLKILIKVSLEYHELWGLSLVVSDIDASYTFGEMALGRLNIINRLKEDGVFDMNREMAFPYVPKKIAVISSKNAAGYTDFIRQLESNPNGYSFIPILFEASMQGVETSESIIKALNDIGQNADFFDIVVIIRGGGSQTDLSWLDSYELAYHITQFPLPIITGIGHTKDMTVADMVSHFSVKTPTAAADLIINRMQETENIITGFESRMKRRVDEIIDFNKNLISDFSRNIFSVIRLSVVENNEKLSNFRVRLFSNGKGVTSGGSVLITPLKNRLNFVAKSVIKEKQTILQRYYASLPQFSGSFLKYKNMKLTDTSFYINIVDPVNILKKGFTITSLNGKLIKDGNLLNPGDIIDTQFSTKKIKSKVLGQ